MHDVRMVSDCLYWKYGIRPTNIFDTQVRLVRFLSLLMASQIIFTTFICFCLIKPYFIGRNQRRLQSVTYILTM